MTKDTDIRWLYAGAVAGIAAVGYGSLDRDFAERTMPEDAIAMVNEQVISRDTFNRTVERQQYDSEDPLTNQDRSWVLQRLIEEELLVQRGLDMGIAQSEMEVRSAIVRSLVASITAEADASNPDDDELRGWFADNPERFTYSSAVAVDAWTAVEESVAQDFATALRRKEATSEPDGIRPLAGLPSGFLPPSKLRDYLGASITAALKYSPKDMVAVYANQGRWLIVRIVDKQQTRIADFDSIRTQVLIEYRRNLADRTLRDYLDNLRDRARIAEAAM